MVVKKVKSPLKAADSPVAKKKRKSVNGSGVWEVEAIGTTSPQSEQTENSNGSSELPKKDTTPFQPRGPKEHDVGNSPKQQNEPRNFDNSQRPQNEPRNFGNSPRQQNEPRNSGYTPRQQKDTFSPGQKMGPWPPGHGGTSNEFTLNTAALQGWTNGDILQLVTRIEDNYAEYFSLEYSEAINKVDWTKISFGKHTATACQEVWDLLFKKARTTRELIQEARKLLLGKRPRLLKDEDLAQIKKDDVGLQETTENDSDEAADEEDKNDSEEEEGSGNEEEGSGNEEEGSGNEEEDGEENADDDGSEEEEEGDEAGEEEDDDET